MISCPHDPKQYLGAPIGMYHCPECGTMVIAGLEHPSDEAVSDQGLEPYPNDFKERYLQECESCGAITWHKEGRCLNEE